MTGRRTPDEVERRLEEVRRLLRERHAGIEPDAHFAQRVVARLPRDPEWSLAWAARRVLPVSLVFAMALMIAAVATARSSSRTAATPAAAASAQTEVDPLLWLLESGEERP
jgi:hypothetical protein